MSYVNVEARDLNIGDLVKGRGRVARVDDHDTLPNFVVVVFERPKDREEKLDIIRAKALLKVRCDDGLD